MWTELYVAMKHGNVYLLTVAVILFVSQLVVFERLFSIYFFYSINFRKFINNLKKYLTSKDYDGAIKYCRAHKSSVPKIALNSLEAHDLDPSSVEGVIEEGVLELLPKVEKGINLLPGLATLTLLVGVTGTIDGVWETFKTVDILDTTRKQIILSNGLASSLNSTALGLISATIIMVGHFITSGLALRILAGVNHTSSVLSNLLVPKAPLLLATQDKPAEQAKKDNKDKTTEKKDVEASQNEEQNSPEEPSSDASNNINDEEEII